MYFTNDFLSNNLNHKKSSSLLVENIVDKVSGEWRQMFWDKGTYSEVVLIVWEGKTMSKMD